MKKDISQDVLLSSGKFEKERKYWLDKLSGDLTISRFPLDLPGAQYLQMSRAIETFYFPGKIYDQLLKMSNASEYGIFIILLTGISYLLSKYTGNGDIIIGIPVFKQDSPVTSSTSSYFNDILALRTQVNMEMTFKDLLLEVKQTVSEANENMNYPFDEIIRLLNVQGAVENSQLFYTMIRLKNIHNKSHMREQTCDVIFTFDMTEEQMGCEIDYNSTLPDTESIGCLWRYLTNFFAAVTQNPISKLSGIEILTRQERQQILNGFNNNIEVDYPADQTISVLFESQVEKTPDRIAAVGVGDSAARPGSSIGTQLTTAVSYRELNKRANQLARRLRRKGVKPDKIVGIMPGNSIEMAAAITAVLKAGGGCLPLVSGTPLNRVAAMMEDCQTSILLTKTGVIDNRDQIHGDVEILLLDQLSAEPYNQSYHDLDNVNHPLDIAFTFFTSGSTGKPNGVLLNHRGVNNNIFTKINELNAAVDDIFCLSLRISFNASVWLFFSPLFLGARLVIYPEEVMVNIYEFFKRVSHDHVTILEVVPSVLNSYLEILETEKTTIELNHVNALVLTGEEVLPSLVNKFYTRYRVPLVNAYGQTEYSDDSLHYKIPYNTETNIVAAGRLANNTRIYITGTDGNLQPPGAPGELYVWGDGLTRGYLNQPELTAKKFVTNPFMPGEQMYKTGDLACWLPDRNVKVSGRIDRQVKVMGNRIELGEIENKLLSHKKVRKAVITAREYDSGDNYLCAYIVTEKADQDLSIPQLREYLSNDLPAYMIPSYFIGLEEIPLNPNGKVDKKALPAPGLTAETEYEAPRDRLEKILVDLWQRFLGIEKVGIHDNFFRLGGNSIKGMTLVNQYQKLLREMVNIKVVFAMQTIAELAVFFKGYYPQATARLAGVENKHKPSQPEPVDKLDAKKAAEVRRLLLSFPTLDVIDSSKNPPAIFILSSQRSGSTLLRVMLGGHPKLFAPPELGLLMYNQVNQISEYLQSAVRCIKEIKNCSVEEARQIFKEIDDRNTSTKDFYRLLQEWIGDRVLVDKTPPYALFPKVLKRAEQEFENPLYIHLVRHPYGMINSKAEAKLDFVIGVLQELSMPSHQISELEWLISQQNILQFLQGIPGNRKYQVRFEDLLNKPRDVMEGICLFLGLPFAPEMLEPNKNPTQQMTDGIYDEGIMMGDPRFHEHTGIDPEVADKWKKKYKVDFLGDITWHMAESFGYERIETGAYSTIQPVEQKEYYPLTSVQMRLYYLWSMDSESLFYNCPKLFVLKGEMSKDGLIEKFKRLINRHESLRTSFEFIDAKPYQKVHYNFEFEIDFIEPRYEETKTLLDNLIRPFDLGQAPLLRVMMIKRGETEHILVVDMHHIISDGVSVGIMIKDFILTYKDKDAALPPLKLQYKDFAEWNYGRQDQIRRLQEKYWLKRFEGEIPVLNLPIDYKRPSIQSFEGNELHFQLGKEETEKLKSLAREEDTTLFILMLAIFNILLWKESGSQDIVVGTPIAGRRHIELENIIGMFVNTLALRNFPSGGKPFREFLREVNDNTIDAFDNQEYSLEWLVEQVIEEKDSSRNPLFDVVFTIQDRDIIVQECDILEMELEPLQQENKIAKFDLTFIGLESKQGLNFIVEYCTRLFKQETIEWFIRDFKHILSSVLDDPGKKLSEIEIISEEEENEILYQFNDELENE